ncbi:MAG: hypothetical protein K2N98_12380, partial [Lachnospiraceae bacterium]|nr:hypothetical protein [Lachnospiraceae bacterium]
MNMNMNMDMNTNMDIKTDYMYHYDSPLGEIILASDGEALSGLWFRGQKYFGSTLGEAPVQRTLPVFDRTKEWLDI